VITFLVLIGVLAALAIGYALGRHGRRGPAAAPERAPPAAPVPATTAPAPVATAAPGTPAVVTHDTELHRLVRSYEAEALRLRGTVTTRDAAIHRLRDFAEDRHRLYAQLADSRAETARYRQLVVDIENNAAPIFFGPSAPDDLKLIVGVGPVLERMLHQLGVTRYREIAHWSERDIDDFDARLPEFPGRIRRDTWVTQARALHQSKYGEQP
jgi:predicted flap endonuclease-1-like 5' DNA nuclease